MAKPQMHEIDPKGDTLFILRNPDAPFAVSSTGEEWLNALSQHQSGESKYQEASITFLKDDATDDTSSSSDLLLMTPVQEEEKEIQLRVSSQPLRIVSKYFERMMCGDWNETHSEPGFKYTVKATDWDQEALIILMKIIHHQTRSVPRTITLEILAKLAVLVDYYDCREAVEPWVETWVSNLGAKVSSYYCRDLLLRLTVAWVFSEHGIFRILTKVIIQRSRGPIQTMGLATPKIIIDALEERRKSAISDLITRLQCFSDHLYVGEDECSSFDCLSMQLGCIAKNLFDNGLQPLPAAPFAGYSISALGEALFKFQYPDWTCKFDKTHITILERNILNAYRECYTYCEDGLDLHQF
ncbi:hypothetical protein EDB80DRAFT_596492 [Ilyonectria destructans]|nr:hypothetical protein EDB80DRAFT_596492 [Ilyonectria destructans]